MTLPLDPLLALWGEPLGEPTRRPASLAAVSTDSRADLNGALFVPLVGERFDGHRFLETALAGGAAAAVAQRDRLSPEQLEAVVALGRPVWFVDDTLLAYQELGRLWRRQLAVPVVAVTGSAGKTTTRELIRASLACLGPVVASSGNENNDVGAPLTLLKADATTRALVVEMGMRGLGEIERLSRCAEPDVAVITNIGTAHIGRLGSREAIATAKCEISAALRPDGLVVIPAGDSLLEAALAAGWSGRVQRVALADDELAPGTPPPDLVGRLVAPSPASDGDTERPEAERPEAERLDAERQAPEHLAPERLVTERQAAERLEVEGLPPMSLPLAGRHNARNLLLALAVALELGVAPAALSDLTVEVPGGRNRRLQLGGVTVLDETYNASPEAMLAALDLLAAQLLAVGAARYAVLGTMLELGESSLALHRRVAERARNLGLEGLVIVDGGGEGAAMLEAAAGLERLVRVARPEEALEPLLGWLRPGDALLLKASRGVALERLLSQLQERLG
ncbi:MAG: UDP-N-acetylmuramoyl-tripeptide--D-alanyl-D-alanine ligase [Cyanobacteria bacterium]|nr:UDP-N-acetylmuramoyl-tripeptide--D-alanyl-D-alanine ligase [Cyanobacteriota bacterium]